MKLLVFLHGTLIMNKKGFSVADYTNYVPIGHAVEKLKQWQLQGAEIIYLSALTEDKKTRDDEVVGKNGLRIDQQILDKYGFPKGKIYHRQNNENYADIAEKIMPDILIEDDCESIGGEKEMVYSDIKPELKARIKHIVVKEFEGINHLQDRVEILAGKD